MTPLSSADAHLEVDRRDRIKQRHVPVRRIGLGMVSLGIFLAMIWGVSKLDVSRLVPTTTGSETYKRHVLTFSNVSDSSQWIYIDKGISLQDTDFRHIVAMENMDYFTFHYDPPGIRIENTWKLVGAFSRIYLGHIDNKWIDMFSLGVLAPTRADVELRFADSSGFKDIEELEAVMSSLFSSAGWNILFHDDGETWISWFVFINGLACFIGSAILYREVVHRVSRSMFIGMYKRHRRSVFRSQELEMTINRHKVYANDVEIVSRNRLACYDSRTFSRLDEKRDNGGGEIDLENNFSHSTPLIPKKDTECVFDRALTVLQKARDESKQRIEDEELILLMRIPKEKSSLSGEVALKDPLSAEDIKLGLAPVSSEFAKEQRDRIEKNRREREKQRAFHKWVMAKRPHTMNLFSILDQICLGRKLTFDDMQDGQSHWKFCITSTVLHSFVMSLAALWLVPMLGLENEDILYKISQVVGTIYILIAFSSLIAHHLLSVKYMKESCTLRLVRLLYTRCVYPAFSYLSLTFVVHLTLWFFLGIILKPEICVPIIVNLLLIVCYVISTYKRLHSKKQKARIEMKMRQYKNGCLHLHDDEEDPPSITNRRILLTILYGVVWLMCVMVFIALGFFAFSTDQIDSVYYTLLLSVGPALTAFGTKLFNIKEMVDDEKKKYTSKISGSSSDENLISDKYSAFIKNEEEGDEHSFMWWMVGYAVLMIATAVKEANWRSVGSIKKMLCAGYMPHHMLAMVVFITNAVFAYDDIREQTVNAVFAAGFEISILPFEIKKLTGFTMSPSCRCFLLFVRWVLLCAAVIHPDVHFWANKAMWAGLTFWHTRYLWILLFPLVCQFSTSFMLGWEEYTFWVAAWLAAIASAYETRSLELIVLVGSPGILIGWFVGYVTPGFIPISMGTSAGAYFGSLFFAKLFAWVSRNGEDNHQDRSLWHVSGYDETFYSVFGRLSLLMSMLPAFGLAAFTNGIGIGPFYGASAGTFILFGLLLTLRIRGHVLRASSTDHAWIKDAKTGLNALLVVFGHNTSRMIIKV